MKYILLILPLFPMLGSILVYASAGRMKSARNPIAEVICILEFLLCAGLLVGVIGGEAPELRIAGVCVNGLQFKLDGFRAIYVTVASFMWMMTTVFSGEYMRDYHKRARYYALSLLTFGATVGMFLSADLFTTFIFFEIMSFASYALVAHEETAAALRAAETYFAVSVIGGMVMLMGLFLLYHMTGTLEIDKLLSACAAVTDRGRLYLSAALLLCGFGAKAGMFPLHVWLPKAHPVAPAPASALLSGVLTKSGVFGVLVISCDIFLHDPVWGRTILLLGVVTMFLGAFIALFSIDLKRTLACSSLSQIGFILVGVGMQGLLGEENTLAAWGTLLHMVNHSLIKLVLFTAAGTVYMNLHKLDLNDIRGFGRGKPLLMICFLMGALSIAGVPLWSGFISKTLLHESIVEFIHHLEHLGVSAGAFRAAEWIFLLSGGMTAAYMTKLFVCIFMEKPRISSRQHGASDRYLSKRSAITLIVPAAMLLLLGLFPQACMVGMARLGSSFMHAGEPAHAIHFFSWENLKGAAISISIGAVLYFGAVRTLLMKTEADGSRSYVDRWPAFLDLEDLVYRPLLRVLAAVLSSVLKVVDGLPDLLLRVLTAALSSVLKVVDGLPDLLLHVIATTLSFVLRVADNLTDWLIILLRSTLLRSYPIVPPCPEDDMPASVIREESDESPERMFRHTLSHAQILFGLGFCVVLIVLLLR